MERGYGVGAAGGEVPIEGDTLAIGDGVVIGCTKSVRKALKSGLLITNVPSCSSVRDR